LKKHRLGFCRITGSHQARHERHARRFADSPTSNLALRGMPSEGTIEEKMPRF
jgi:hypothetical protein